LEIKFPKGDHMSYGRHQSFYLKKHWINKGIKALKFNNSEVLIDKDGYKSLGLGKNMQQSLRYWLEATNIVHLDTDTKEHNLTHFGQIVDKYDPACMSKFTLMMIHFFLVDSTIDGEPNSHSFNWFFKIYPDSVVTKDGIKENLNIYAKTVAPNTVAKDVDCLLQSYTNNEKDHPEDKNVALLANLGLIKKDKNIYVKISAGVDMFSAFALYYALNEKKNQIDLTIDQIVNHIGAIFNWGRTDIIELIEILANLGFDIRITRTNNLDTVSLNEKKHLDELLKLLFERAVRNEDKH